MIELFIIVVLLAFNGIFAMAEIAVVSARRARLKRKVEEGDRRAALALKLAEDPERFLSTVQIGITLVGVLAGAFGGSSLAGYLVPFLDRVPWIESHAEQIAFVMVVAFITYLSLIIGELVPKNVALRNPEGIACAMAAPLDWLSRIARPLVWMLEVSTHLVMRVFGKSKPPSGPTRDEVEVLVREGIVTGGLHREESEMVEGVFDLREVRAEEIMRPKPKVVFLHIKDTALRVAPQLQATRQTVFPVCEDSRDHVAGLVSLRELYTSVASGATKTLQELMREPIFVPDNQPALTLLGELRRAPLNAALVTDEFGIVRGLVTLDDLVEEVVGDLTHALPGETTGIRETEPGIWLVDGMTEIDDVAAAIPGVEALIKVEKESFQSLAGYIVHFLRRLPKEGESFTAGEFKFEVVDMDRQRIDKVAIRKVSSSHVPAPSTA